MSPMRHVLSQPSLRMVALALIVYGAFNASVYPYQSLIGIQKIGLSEPAFAAVLVLASIVAVITSVMLGILSDQRANRRQIALGTMAVGVVGVGLMVAFPGPLALIACHGIAIPVTSSFYGQIFALSRLATHGDPQRRDGVQSTLRAGMSAGFLAMLVFWAVIFATGVDVTSVYLSGLVAGLLLVAMIWWMWPRAGAVDWQDQPSGMGFTASLREIAHPHVLLRVACLGAIGSAGHLYMILISLVFDASAVRDAGDVALYVGLVAGCEVPFMLALPRLMARLPRQTLIAWGTALYCGHLVLMPILVDTAWLWALTLVAGLGGTAIITLPITYYQDLLAGKPGAAGSLLAVQRLVGEVMAALAFVIGTAFGGYGLTAMVGAGIAVAGAGALLIADRQRVTP